MYDHPKELASHGAEFPCVSARARVYYGWSVRLTDFLVLREQHIHPVPSFLVGVGGTLLQLRSGTGNLAGARRKDGRKVSLHLMRVDLIRAVLCKPWFAHSGCKGVGMECTAPGQVCAPPALSFLVEEREAQ